MRPPRDHRGFRILSTHRSPFPSLGRHRMKEREYFDNRAQEYDTQIFDVQGAVGRDRIHKRAASILLAAEVVHGLRVLDVGCGTGEYTREFRPYAGEFLVSFDVSIQMVRIAKAKSDGMFMVADAHDLPFKTGVFDRVLGNAVLHHLPDLDRGLREINRVSKVKKQIAFREPNLWSPGKFWAFVIPVRKLLTPHRWSPDERAFSRRTIERKLHKQGYSDVDVRYAGLVLPRCPKKLAPFLYQVENICSRIPVIRCFLGSLIIRART